MSTPTTTHDRKKTMYTRHRRLATLAAALAAAVLAASLAALAVGRYTLTIPEVVSALGSPITGAFVPDAESTRRNHV